MAQKVGLVAVLVTCLSGAAVAMEGSGNPWQTIDDAMCAGLKLRDFSGDVGAEVNVTLAGRMPESATLPGYCRVVATIAPKNSVEIRLPVSGWSGRLLMAGCGGLCGSIQMERTDDALARRYAVAHTDMGHGETDVAFADDPAALEDFVHRSTHVATKLLKAAAKAYYDRPHDYAYFRGCSTGGRQGLTAALMYPDDYDGIIAGAPAAGPAIPNIAWALKANTRADGSSILDTAGVQTLHAGVLAACDLDDGVRDNIISDPPSCRFKPETLTCGQNALGPCLTDEQVAAAKKIYAGPPNASMGYPVGGELGWLRTLVKTDKPAGMEGVSRNYLRRFADLPNPPKTLAELDFAAHTPRLAPVDALPSLGADGRKLTELQKSGGKLLLYHSWADDSLTPATAIDFYRANEKSFGGAKSLDDFFRLFVLPGMFHCRGGEGADSVDFLSAIETWVEKGTPPDKLIAYKTNTARPITQDPRFPLPASDVKFSRPIFPFPAASRYSGRGDMNDSANWERN
jgi:pimeloyl-ACP methyl ester carboxylesterase